MRKASTTGSKPRKSGASDTETIDSDAMEFVEAMWAMGLTTLSEFEAALAETVDRQHPGGCDDTLLQGFDDLLECI